jgi:hypothetical protein
VNAVHAVHAMHAVRAPTVMLVLDAALFRRAVNPMLHYVVLCYKHDDADNQPQHNLTSRNIL